MLFQSLYILQLLSLGALPLVKGLSDYPDPPDSTNNSPVPRGLFPTLWFYDGEPSTPVKLGAGEGGTDDGQCQPLEKSMSVGIGSDPEKATVSNNDGCVLLFEEKGCGGNSVPIKIPYQDEPRCRKFGFKTGDFKSYKVRAAFGCEGWGPVRDGLDEVKFTEPKPETS